MQPLHHACSPTAYNKLYQNQIMHEQSYTILGLDFYFVYSLLHFVQLYFKLVLFCGLGLVQCLLF